MGEVAVGIKVNAPQPVDEYVAQVAVSEPQSQNAQKYRDGRLQQLIGADPSKRLKGTMERHAFHGI